MAPRSQHLEPPGIPGRFTLFLDAAQLDHVLPPEARTYFGTLEELKGTEFRGRRQAQGFIPHATLTRIDDPLPRPSSPSEHRWLGILKPTLRGKEPLDVCECGGAQPDFPQQRPPPINSSTKPSGRATASSANTSPRPCSPPR